MDSRLPKENGIGDMFKIKEKPEKPEKKQKVIRLDIEYKSLKELMELVPTEYWDRTCFESEYYDGGGRNVILSYIRPQADEEYLEELKKFEKKLKEYNEWLEANKENIEEYKQKKKETYNKKLATQIANLEKEKKKLEKQLGNLEKI